MSSLASLVAVVVKKLPASAREVRDAGSIPELGRPLEQNVNPFQYSCLENSVGRGAWRTIVHFSAKD